MNKSSALRLLQDASNSLFGDSFWRNPQIKLRTVYWINGLSNYPILNALTKNTLLGSATASQRGDPEHLGILMWPLVDARWNATKRLEMMASHYHEANSIGAGLTLAIDEVKTLVQFADDLSILSIRLERQGFFRREGQLALSLFHGEDRIYSVAFLISQAGGERVAYVGAIQGVKQSEDSSLYKTLTKDAHGLRPRDFTISAFLVFCKAIGVHCVYAVRDDNRQHRHSYFGRGGKAEVFANYDVVWEEHEGKATPDGYFELPVGIRIKDPASIPSKKRSMYRKRYALLEDVQSAIKAAIAENAAVRLDGIHGVPTPEA